MGGNHPTPRPLIARVIAGEGHCAHYATPVDHCAPHVQIEPAIVIVAGSSEGILEFSMAW